MYKGSTWAVLLAACCACDVSIARAAALGQIMPLGDSITWGDAYTSTGIETPVAGGYRQELYSNLGWDGNTFSFVGSVSTNSTAALTAAHASANEGHSGYLISDLTSCLDGSDSTNGDAGHWLTGLGTRPAVSPDTILLMAGTNDIDTGVAAGMDVTVKLDALLTKIFALRPSVHLYLSELLPIPWSAAANASVPVWNSLLPAEVSKFQAQGRNIALVHSDAAFLNSNGSANTALFGSDGLHPNQAGYNVLGDVWTTAMLSGKDLTVTGPMRLIAASTTGVAPLNVGAIKLAAGGTLEIDQTAKRTVLVASSLSLQGGVLNLHNNDLIIHGGVLSAVVAGIKQGSIKGDSTDALAVVANTTSAGGILTSSFDGQAVGKSDLLVKRTVAGDTNLDGTVSFLDLLAVAQHYNDLNTTWSGGDFNYDGKTTFSDLLAIAQHYNQTVTGLQVAQLQEAGGASFATAWAEAVGVPEPAGAAVVLFAGAGLGRRRVRDPLRRN